MRIRLANSISIAAAVLLSPHAASADIGVPLVAIFLPPLWAGLIPIIVIEAFVISRQLAARFGYAMLPAGIGNIISAIIGLPISWMLFATIEGIFFGSARGLATLPSKIYAVTVQSPWLIPYEADLWWMVPAALFVFFIPCYLISVIIEAPINRLFFRESRIVWKATAIANAWSYLFLAVLVTGYLALNFNVFNTPFAAVVEYLVDAVFRIASFVIGK